MPSTNDYDLVIIGGGLAGASLACALNSSLSAGHSAGHSDGQNENPGVSQHDRVFKIAVVEAFDLQDTRQPSYDDRTLALAWGSRLIYQAYGLWPAISEFAEEIKTIHISNRGYFGVTRLTHEQESVEALGYVVENRRLGLALYQQMQQANPGVQIDLLCPASLQSLEQDEEGVSLVLSQHGDQHAGKRGGQDHSEQASNEKTSNQKASNEKVGQSIRAGMVVAADGNNSSVLKLLNIGSNRQDYQQSAVIANVTPGTLHNNVAYERFTDTGPIAMLPMSQNRCSLVWTLPPAQADQVAGLEDSEFLAALQQAFGYRLGEISRVGSRHVYPLFLQAASQMCHGRVAVLGNAAHSVHPVAGQGFNLALRDIALLTDLVEQAWHGADDFNASAVIERYAALRTEDIRRVYRFTDSLVKLFSNANRPLAHARSCGLLMVDLMPEFKHGLAAHSMGMSAANMRDIKALRKLRYASTLSNKTARPKQDKAGVR